jgi:polysaccharide biosynthesis protein PelA
VSFLLALAVLAADEPREILCLYDSAEKRSPDVCEIHLYAETVLNYLGLVAAYRNVNEPLPGDEEMKRYRGILTWFSDSRMKKSRAYWKWIARQPAAGRKVVILGNLGATDDVPVDVINDGLRPLGLTYQAKETGNPAVLEIVKKSRMVEFERTVAGELRWFFQLKADPDSEVFLKVRRTDLDDSESDLAVVGPNGGFSYVTVHYDPYVDRDQWRLDPFAFLSKAFGVERLPRPDFTTAAGRRICFVSIDGDGIANRVQPGPKVGRFSGELVRDEFLKKIDLPVTASVIAADLDAHAELAKSIFSLPNVEVGAHGYYHPTIWKEQKLAYPGTFDLRREVIGAVRRIEEVSPKPVKAYLWTGDCMPPPEAVAMCDSLGLANINGSDPGRYQNYEFLANLRSPSLLNGESRQFNARSMSENHFTDLWTHNFFAYRNLLSAFRRTDAPYRVTPIHVYFHFYLVEQPAGEAALREIFDWVLRQEIHPMTASEYVSWLRGFFSTRFEDLGNGSWRVRDYGACRTIRFDATESSIDLARSKNVLGFRRVGTTLYVHLDGADEAILALGTAPSDRPYLMHSNGVWKDGRIVAQTAASATFMTPAGPVEKKGKGHEMEVEFR